MNDADQRFIALARETLPPVGPPGAPADLWARLEERLDKQQPARLSRMDWVLVAIALGALAGSPESVLLLAYYF